MSEETIEHIILAICAAIPSTIAAISSLKNGKTIVNMNGKISSASHKRSNKKAGGADGNTASDPDWYKPPDV